VSGGGPSDYAGRRVIVSGCASGIGRAVAEQLVALGAEAHGLDWKPADLALASFVRTDLREPQSIEEAVARIGGRVDGLFNCAGLPPGAPPLDVMKVNFVGARHLADLVVPMMAPGGAIANVASTGGAGWSRRVPELTELATTPSYEAAVEWCARRPELVAEGYRFSKEAIVVWTMFAASRLIAQGVRMNATSPGAVQTPLLAEIEKTTPSAAIDAIAEPIGRRSTPEEQAPPLLMLNAPGASYVNGVVLPVDGGFMSAAALGGAG
jgi:NAD(P)-dependent dehydrogenase (short-subunit alcohol dehydrogenase family)